MTSDRNLDLYGDDARMRRILRDSRHWFVVGLGDNPDRVAYGVSAMLADRGKDIVPIHPSAASVHGQTGYPSVTAAAEALGAPDVVDVFLRSELVGPIVDEAIAADAKAVWLQLGVIDEAAAARARLAGLDTVMDHCPAQEWPRLGPPDAARRA